MSNTNGYRAFPPEIFHPKESRVLNESEFSSLGAIKIQEAPGVSSEHLGTVVWYVKNVGYFIQVKLKGAANRYVSSVCTFTPTQGMDMIDGLFAQDIEEYILEKELGIPTSRLNLFGENNSVSIEFYLRTRGVIK